MIRLVTYLVFLFGSTSLLAQNYTRTVGNKSFELSNHLGNVLEVTTDRKVDKNTEAEIVAFNDYYPYGMLMEGRHGQQGMSSYRYAFNGMEDDSEIYNQKGYSYTTKFRQLDSRIGRWLSLDPLRAKYPGQSPYSAFNNNPVHFADPTGLEGDPATSKDITAPDGSIRRVIGSNFKAFKSDECNCKYSENGERADFDVEVFKGSVSQFTFNDKIFVATWGVLTNDDGSKSHYFKGYKNKNEGYYQDYLGKINAQNKEADLVITEVSSSENSITYQAEITGNKELLWNNTRFQFTIGNSMDYDSDKYNDSKGLPTTTTQFRGKISYVDRFENFEEKLQNLTIQYNQGSLSAGFLPFTGASAGATQIVAYSNDRIGRNVFWGWAYNMGLGASAGANMTPMSLKGLKQDGVNTSFLTRPSKADSNRLGMPTN